MTAPTSSALGALTCAALCATLHAQAPQLHAVFAASEHRGGAPAIAWLCEEVLPARPEWPDDLDPQAARAVGGRERERARRPVERALPPA